ncbi:uncharacterized protein LOC132705353 isoform X4 [Cylas formicarius]|uniref:uncharacterized protein LOC132705353 isoform X4 n=1 Tax=Cylas formicarius TaxID=197179 RepID=UPI002958ABFF|nr:uncharacterized protein LOC132705353 isoform X4 [Cylas formicarius]
MDQIFQWLILFCGINNFHISGGAVVNPDRPFQLEHKQSNLFLNENLKFVESKQQAATFMLESYSSSRRTDRYIKEVKSGWHTNQQIFSGRCLIGWMQWKKHYLVQ